VWRERHDLIDTTVILPECEDEDDHQSHSSNQPPVLRTRQLPSSAFFSPCNVVPKTSPITASAFNDHQTMSLPLPPTRDLTAFNPFFDTIRQNAELSHGIIERIPLRLPCRVRRRITDLPFAWLQDIARRATTLAPRLAKSSSITSSSSEDDQDDDASRVEEGTEALAAQFYRIELAEQKRMLSVMDFHTRESGQLVLDCQSVKTIDPEVSTHFPFSITAGIEKGAKNRYVTIVLFLSTLFLTRLSDTAIFGHLNMPE
jgi:tyrosine-protein phosphatase 2/3